MFTIEKLENILNEKILEIKKTSYGVTNNNFIIIADSNKYFYRNSKKFLPIHSKDNEKEAINLLENEQFFLKILYFDDNNLITNFQENLKTFISCKNLSNIIKISKILKNFHNKKFKTNFLFNPIKALESYLNNIESIDLKINEYLYLIEEFKKHYTPDRLCHNELSEGNFLFTKNNLYLIDYEYAGLNDPYFDIASFISENNLNYQEIITFLSGYFDKDSCNFKKLNIFIKFYNLFKLSWASMMYKKYNEEIYNSIIIENYTKLKNHKNIYY